MYHFLFLSPSIGLWLFVPFHRRSRVLSQLFSFIALHFLHSLCTLHKALLIRVQVLTWTHVFLLDILLTSTTRKQIVCVPAPKADFQIPCDRRFAGSRSKISVISLWVLFSTFPSIFSGSSKNSTPEGKQMKWFRALRSHYHIFKFLKWIFKFSLDPFEKKETFCPAPQPHNTGQRKVVLKQFFYSHFSPNFDIIEKSEVKITPICYHRFCKIPNCVEGQQSPFKDGWARIWASQFISHNSVVAGVT